MLVSALVLNSNNSILLKSPRTLSTAEVHDLDNKSDVLFPTYTISSLLS